MAGQLLPPSFVARLVAQLRTCDQPLIQVWGWPWSGKRALLTALAASDPDGCLELAPHAPLRERISRSGPRCFLARGNYRAVDLLVAAELLGPDQRLIFPVERRIVDEILPARVLDPSQMLLRSVEIEEMFDGVGQAGVDELRQRTDGWAGPLGWLRDHWQRTDALEQAIRSPGFTTRFHQRVAARLDPDAFDLVLECSLEEELDVALWRRVWIAHPEKLACLERLIGEWGWLITEDGTPRQPRLLQQAARTRGLSAQRQRDIHRRLGLAAHALGLGQAATRHLDLAGDASRVGRLRALGPGSLLLSDAGPAAGGARAAPSGSSPRFLVRLLGQPGVQRIDGGARRDLTWRLRRAFESLAFLASSPGRRASKEELIDAVWRDVGARSIAKNFHPSLSEARRTLGHREVFTYWQGLYTLNPELDWWVDCERFSERLEEGRRLLAATQVDEQDVLGAWKEAWGLYRGPFLAGTEAAWVEPRRAQLYRDYIELLRGTGGLRARLGHTTQALDAYRSLLIEEPFEEKIHVAVMELYSQQGRRDLVRRQFVRMQELLQQELNVEPLEETLERYHQLMR